MDRLDAMKTFVTVLDHGSLAAASRALSRSPAAVSRAISALEQSIGAELLHRTPRALRLSEAGEQFAPVCRRVLLELEAAAAAAREERATPRGVLTISAPPIAGEEILRPIVEQFLAREPEVSVRLLLLDRPVRPLEEGVDVALRVGRLPDSALIATRVGGAVRRVVVGAPEYLKSAPSLREPADLPAHQIVAFTNFGADNWTFAPVDASGIPRSISFKPRLAVNSVPAALKSALAGLGLTRLYSYHVSDAVRAGALRVLLADAEQPAAPVHLLTIPGRGAVPKVRAFLDFAAPRLRARFDALADDAQALA